MQMEAGNHLNLRLQGSLKNEAKTRIQLVTFACFYMVIYTDVEDKQQASFSLRENLHPE